VVEAWLEEQMLNVLWRHKL